MIIYFKDGSTLNCETIEIDGGSLFADQIYSVDIWDVERIESR